MLYGMLMIVTAPLTIGSAWSASPAKAPEACSLITDADAEQITKVPMKQEPVQYPINCTYKPATPVSAPVTLCALNVMSHADMTWGTSKKSVSGNSPLPGLGDDAFYVRSTKTEAAIYVLKGNLQFTLTCGGPNPDLFDAMKAVANRIASKL
jgi:hypothetical protein